MYMLIYRDNIVRTQVHAGFSRNGKKPDTIVIHGTAGGGTLNWWRYGHKNHPDNKYAQRHKRGVGLTHYLIELDGKIIEIYDPATRWVYHSSQGKEDARTIGIELKNKSWQNKNEYTDEQYQATAELINFLKSQFEIATITTHDRIKISRGQEPKGCPGSKFSFQKLKEKMKEKNFEEVSYGKLDN